MACNFGQVRQCLVFPPKPESLGLSLRPEPKGFGLRLGAISIPGFFLLLLHPSVRKPWSDLVATFRLFSPLRWLFPSSKRLWRFSQPWPYKPLFYDALLRLPPTGSIASIRVPDIRSLLFLRRVFAMPPKKHPVILKPPLPQRPRPGIGLSV